MESQNPYPLGSPAADAYQAQQKRQEKVLEDVERINLQKLFASDLKLVGRDAISAMSDIELSGWQAIYPMDSPHHLIANYEWNLRLLNRQIAAARKDSWRTLVGTLGGAIIGVLATLMGVFVPRLLDGQKTDAVKQQISSPPNPTTNTNPQGPIPPNVPAKETGFDKPIEFRLNP